MTLVDSAIRAPFLSALVAALLLTPLVRAFARKVGAVAQPRTDRWHNKPTAMLGGVAIFLAVMAAAFFFAPRTREVFVVIGASTGLFLVGLLDDIFQMKPYQKLIGQLLGASAVVYFGLILPWTESTVVNMIITFFWLVGVTNAVNMLDNMDGLAAGVSAIAALFLAINFLVTGQITAAIVLASFCGALAGFLVFNHNPASIFMGDCGSMFVGFLLASAGLMSGTVAGRSRSIVAVLAVPVLVLAIPIFDTTFVTLARKLNGRAASQGGRDHTSHRLVALGLSERDAVWMLYAFAVLGGLISVAVRRMQIDVSIAIITIFTIGLALVGVYLARVRVYSEEEMANVRQKPVVTFLVDLSYKRRIFEVFLDVVLIGLAQYCSYAIVFGPMNKSDDWQLFLKTIPLVIFIKLGTFVFSGVYRGLWRYASVSDVVVFARASFLGSVFTILLFVGAYRFEGFSRTVFGIDCLLLMMMLTTTRFAFRVLRKMLPAPHSKTGKRVLIYGAGDGGEMVFRELHNNSHLQFVPVAFFDDDARKSGRILHGLRVHSGKSLGELCRNLEISEVFLSTMKVPAERLREIVAECETVGVPVKRMSIDIQRVADTELGWALAGSEPALPATLPRTAPVVPIDRPRASEH